MSLRECYFDFGINNFFCKNQLRFKHRQGLYIIPGRQAMNGMKVLFIDDDKFLCEFVQIVFKTKGIHIDYVHDGWEGIKQFASVRYTAVVVDQMMPGLDGFQVIREITGMGREIPLIMLSGSSREEDKRKATEAGALCYVEKGYDSQFIGKLQLILERVHVQTVD